MGIPDIASPGNSGSVHLDRCELQDVEYVAVTENPVWCKAMLELLDMVACAIVEIDTAADIIESKNATYKTAVWLVDQLGLEVNGLAVAVDAMAVDTIAAPTMPWDGRAGLA
ncbi:hypothetical protein BDP55DRAFT_639458 [Colletotrichum godetiae]|uniref:Uncharacterized protein n=1 Tax=Colletotrichum godetiae TaxID=1209918 RepID=A0AAJ0A539_9PEZI|nr:uncharacterized protein BDP55DRAFT_639458 [Colletotrichum godetiae]KAK1656630.1 hypothetical protein BDP55DRAFT_639458 [Colletotrichum godetiae]